MTGRPAFVCLCRSIMLVCCASTWLACSSETGIRLQITSDLSVPDVLSAIHLVVAPVGGSVDPTNGIGIDTTFSVRTDEGATDDGYVLPVTLGIRPHGDDVGRSVRMEATAVLAGTQCSELRPAVRVRRFVRDEILDVTLDLARVCCGYTGCAATETCVARPDGSPACDPQGDNPIDAGPPDAGPVDLGRDARPPPVDLGLRDAGPDARCLPTAETCNGLDDDCNDAVDDGVLQTFFHDGDGDGYGENAATAEACDVPPGYAAMGDDCDDANGARHPGAAEGCDDVDHDCDGDANCDVSCTCCAGQTQSCGIEVGECAAGTQTCADGAWGTCVGATGPGTEICDALDNDCNDATDEADVCERAVAFDETVQIGGLSGYPWMTVSGDDEFGSNGPCVTVTGTVSRSSTQVSVEVCCRMDERSGDSCSGTLGDSRVYGCHTLVRSFANTGLDSEQSVSFRAQYADSTTNASDTSVPVVTANRSFAVISCNGDTNNQDVCYDQDEPGCSLCRVRVSDVLVQATP